MYTYSFRQQCKDSERHWLSWLVEYARVWNWRAARDACCEPLKLFSDLVQAATRLDSELRHGSDAPNRFDAASIRAAHVLYCTFM